MKYTIGDIFIWKYSESQLSTLVDVYYDWDGEKKYIFESLLNETLKQPITESYDEDELDKFIDSKILEHYPVKK
jgi:hypothetical protein